MNPGKYRDTALPRTGDLLQNSSRGGRDPMAEKGLPAHHGMDPVNRVYRKRYEKIPARPAGAA
ncbi:MAG: hypothetical protein DRH56_06075 [Deltaproteobacteria bacterium]|nr:MAG: hypothetical protein DRH56_06075 [Deltaproteobacteria bacterium]